MRNTVSQRKEISRIAFLRLVHRADHTGHAMSDNFVFKDEYKPLMPNGKYEAQCIKCDQSFVLGKARKLFLHFRILEQGEHYGKEIFMAFNIPYDKKIKQGSKYFKTWVQVNGWRKPSRNAKLSPHLFLNKIYRVKTRTVKPTHNGKEMPKEFWYSVVDCIDEVIQDDSR